MDRSLGTTASPRIQDVTPQILRSHEIYGASVNTNPSYASADRSLNYQVGGSINRPEVERITIIPYKLTFKDAVGLFGSENHFVRVDIDINKSVAFACYEEFGWECAHVSDSDDLIDNTYSPAKIEKFDEIINTYLPAEIEANALRDKYDAVVSIDLNNLKTGNKYIDSWLDVRRYRKDRMEHPYDKMYVRLNDYFYIGFHARNTRRLPYHVECVIGDEYVSGNEIDRRYMNAS